MTQKMDLPKFDHFSKAILKKQSKNPLFYYIFKLILIYLISYLNLYEAIEVILYNYIKLFSLNCKIDLIIFIIFLWKIHFQ